jgi:uncharacterized protein (TIGR03435 family)
LLAATLLLAASTLAAAHQAAPSTAGAPTFEVASIKPNLSGAVSQSGFIENGALVTTNMRLRALIVLAYGIRPERVVGAPSWIDEDRFDVTARAAAAADADVRIMLRGLLAERFRLAVRAEMREQPVYALVVAEPNRGLGANLKPSSECDAGSTSSGGRGSVVTGGAARSATGRHACGVITGSDGRDAYVIGGARSIDLLVRALQGVPPLTERPIVNRTGLAGTYDFELRFAAAPMGVAADASNGPSIFTAVREQLGLRLESGRAPIEFFVVDRVERPTPD